MKNPIIPREVLFGNPEKINPHLSPDGLRLAYVAPDDKNVLQVWMKTLGKNDDQVLTKDKKRGIRSYFWAYDNTHLIYVQDSDGDENWHLFSVNIHTKLVRDLTPFQGIQARVIDLDPAFPNDILVSLNIQDLRKHDVYKVSLKNGAVDFLVDNPGNIVSWTPDAKFNIRAAVAMTQDGGHDLLYRDSSSKPWELLRHWGPDDSGVSLGFSLDGKTLYILGTHDANAMRLIALDLKTKKETILAEDSKFDVGGTSVHPTNRTIQAVSFNKQKLEWKILDPKVEVDFYQISKIRPGQFGIASRDLEDKTWLISFVTDDGPVYYYLYKRSDQSHELLFTHQPRLENLDLAKMEPVSYTSIDGLEIHGYLSLPPGKESKNLPTVLYVHGGPWARDVWGYNSVVQWLTNRGYAVFQINFRGSTGYGKNFLNAGDREWAGKMHQDLIDGVNWIVSKGIADPKKIAIMGGSYGGYATLVGLTFTPNTFCAGVDIVGPSNIVTLLKTVPPYWAPVKAVFDKRVGKLETEEEFLKSRSPLFFVDKIQSPLLIGQGANDPRVKLSESDQIVEAMKTAKKPVEYVVYSDEGHGFARPENRMHFFAKTEKFLSKYLGGRVEEGSQVSGHSAVEN